MEYEVEEGGEDLQIHCAQPKILASKRSSQALMFKKRQSRMLANSLASRSPSEHTMVQGMGRKVAIDMLTLLKEVGLLQRVKYFLLRNFCVFLGTPLLWKMPVRKAMSIKAFRSWLAISPSALKQHEIQSRYVEIVAKVLEMLALYPNVTPNSSFVPF